MPKVDRDQPIGLRPAANPEAREKQMMAAAMKLSYQRLNDGTASSAEIVYWLKQASPQAMLERRNLEMQTQLMEAKIEDIKKAREGNVDYKRVMEAFKGYSPTQTIDGDFEEI